MLSALILEIDEPFKIVVENQLNTISPYILLEQETWFESEVPFFHDFLKPGMRVIDIGTNCGFYTLLAAEKVGDAGHVWGFEPGLKPARLLKEALRINGYSNVTLFEAAAGPAPGTAWFSDLEVTELSSVVDEGTKDAREVRVESLDDLYAAGVISNIDFIKIDAEGFEDQVIAGGDEFFRRESPLVMLEVTSDASPANMGPAETLHKMGYEFYRYLPGAACLVPLVIGKPGDYILNIMLCKADRVPSLQAAGLLVTGKDLQMPLADADPQIFLDYFLQLPITKSCPELEPLGRPGILTNGFTWMAAEYLLSQDKNRPVIERAVRLARAEHWIDGNFRNNIPFAHAISFVRVWAACGRISLVASLLGLIAEGKSGIDLVITGPFLPMSKKWDEIAAIDGNKFPWLASMMAEMLELFRSFSSVYDSAGTRDTYGLLRKYGYLTLMLERRASLATLVRGFDQFPDPAYITGPLKRNEAIWNEIADRLARGEKHVIALDAAVSLE